MPESEPRARGRHLTAAPTGFTFSAMAQDSILNLRGRQPYPDWLARVAPQLQGLKVGGNLVYRDVTASTNDDARSLAQAGAPDGLVVLADCQTHGRGRLGRPWVSPPGGSLLLSALLRHPAPVHEAQQFTMIAGLTIRDAIAAVAGIQADLKWPNDLLIAGRKVAGILAETEAEAGKLRWVVVGMGINVDVDFSGRPELAESAVSLSQATEEPIERGPLLLELIRTFSRRYAAMVSGSSPFEEWAASLATIGQEIEAESGGNQLTGIAERVTPEGALVIKLEDGSRRELFAGDVRLRNRTG